MSCSTSCICAMKASMSNPPELMEEESASDEVSPPTTLFGFSCSCAPLTTLFSRPCTLSIMGSTSSRTFDTMQTVTVVITVAAPAERGTAWDGISRVAFSRVAVFSGVVLSATVVPAPLLRSCTNLQSDERFLQLESSLKNIQETMTAFKANQQSSLTNIQASLSSFKAQFGDLHTRVLALEMKQKQIGEEDRTENNAFREQLDEMETSVQPIAECAPCAATSISTGLMTEIMSTVESRLEEWSGAQGESSGAQGESSGAQGESSGAQGESSGAQGESSGAQGESSGAQSESSEEHENSSGEQLESNGGQDGSSPVGGTLIGTKAYDCQYQPLWTVDLAGTYTVSRVSILNKADCCETCGLSTFTHVPQSDCGDVDIASYEGVTLQFCADACCADTACVSFQHNIWSGCYLKHTICSAGEKAYSPGGHMYDRQVGTGQENFIVRVSPSETTDQNDQCGETYVETPLDGQTIVVHCNPPMSGRYVSVLVRTVLGGGLRYRLKLCMVEVYGTG